MYTYIIYLFTFIKYILKYNANDIQNYYKLL